MKEYLLELMAWDLYNDDGVTAEWIRHISEVMCVSTGDLRDLFEMLRNESRKHSESKDKVPAVNANSLLLLFFFLSLFLSWVVKFYEELNYIF